eukprot:107978_1
MKMLCYILYPLHVPPYDPPTLHTIYLSYTYHSFLDVCFMHFVILILNSPIPPRSITHFSDIIQSKEWGGVHDIIQMNSCLFVSVFNHDAGDNTNNLIKMRCTRDYAPSYDTRLAGNPVNSTDLLLDKYLPDSCAIKLNDRGIFPFLFTSFKPMIRHVFCCISFCFFSLIIW